MSINEESGFPESMANGGEQARESEYGASRFRGAASRAVQTGKAAAQRWGRQSRVVAVNATDRIKDDPVRSVVISFAVGLTLGALIGRLSGRQCQ
jgi:ElaB/YqjD/DUF883 family membrane-anchored ribosome-binding protein